MFFFSANKRRVHSFEPLTDLASNIQCSLDFVKFVVKICEETTNFFSLTNVLFGLLVFIPEVMLEIGAAAYTQVRLIHESLRYCFHSFTIHTHPKGNSSY